MTRQRTGHQATTRTQQPRGSTRRFAQRRRRTSLHRTWGRLDASSRQPRGQATSGRLRARQGTPATTRALRTRRPRESSRDRGAHAGPLDLAYGAAWAQRALDDTNQTIIRREARRRRFDKYTEQEKTAAREASLVVERAHQALAQSVASAAARATSAHSTSTCPQGVASHRPQPGDDAFFQGSVACMTSASRVEFSSALATTVVETAKLASR